MKEIPEPCHLLMDMLMHGGYLPFFISSIPILVFFGGYNNILSYLKPQEVISPQFKRLGKPRSRCWRISLI